ncbi:uncharacterized protein LOC110979489 isoform X2 [Acanthaster planci]|uniref:Uncharacterized protein LOC110979489 isoform X2 n=1 Tax=Acanthaster planci TaxID=133434 RepID=A0A8B7YH99_ACAPL|nr:uncharacterized protein LOC110979489 isoform X2 [Acanthaster planci]
MGIEPASYIIQKECIIVGCEDGIIRVYDIPSGHPSSTELPEIEPHLCLETKGGPVQSLVLADITRFSEADLIAGDSRGTMTIFCNGQILSRQSLSGHSLGHLQVDTDATGNVSVITGDTGGVVHAQLPYSHLWKLRLDSPMQEAESRPSVVKCLLAANLVGSSGRRSNYILASDDCRNLHFIQQGLIVLTLPTPSVITAMCCGNFLPKEEVQQISEMPEATASQVALGGNDGSIIIMTDFQIHTTEYANFQLPIMHLGAIATGHADELDSMLCAGYSHSLALYHSRKLLNQYEASDWINSLAVADLDKNGEPEVLIGCRDGTVEAVKVT